MNLALVLSLGVISQTMQFRNDAFECQPFTSTAFTTAGWRTTIRQLCCGRG